NNVYVHIKKDGNKEYLKKDEFKRKTDGIAFIEGYNVNLRKGPGTSYSKIRQLNKPESYVVWAEKDGWLNLGDEQWVKNDPSYVKF
ncbi:N-acetylmuramoyl-L-alanine amidase, partial [Bacillus cereus group sp. Bce032]